MPRNLRDVTQNLVSAPGFSFSMMTSIASFMLPRPLLVHGSFFTKVPPKLLLSIAPHPPKEPLPQLTPSPQTSQPISPA